MGFEQFLAVLNGQPVTGELYGVVPDAEGRPRPHVAVLSIDFNFPVPFYALVPGGVVPPAFLGFTKASMALDRNVVSGLRQWRDKGAQDGGWYAAVRCLNQVGFESSPFLAAFEGAHKRKPTFDEFCTDLDEIESITRTALPAIAVLDTRAHSRREFMFATCEQMSLRGAREADFLRKASAFLKDRIAEKHLSKRRDEILALAQAAGLQVGSFVVIAALARLYEAMDGSDGGPAQAVLKFHDGYTDDDAHNALADIHQLEIVAGCGAKFQNPALLTGDKKLALLWAGLGVYKAGFNERGVAEVSYRPRRPLFGRLSDEGYLALAAAVTGAR